LKQSNPRPDCDLPFPRRTTGGHRILTDITPLITSLQRLHNHHSENVRGRGTRQHGSGDGRVARA
jgi:hypothetical protein